jgi:hypothetical protein
MICNSGGARGADSVFELQCAKNGIEVIAWSFDGHNTKSPVRRILTKDELDEGFEHVKIANKTLKRIIYGLKPYIKKLLSRNWFQVKNSEAVFAIAHLEGKNKVSGGTGWCCMMAIDCKKPVYVYDSNYQSWFEFDYEINEFKKYEKIPKLTNRFAGVGSREIDTNSVEAIESLLKNQ